MSADEASAFRRDHMLLMKAVSQLANRTFAESDVGFFSSFFTFKLLFKRHEGSISSFNCFIIIFFQLRSYRKSLEHSFQ